MAKKKMKQIQALCLLTLEENIKLHKCIQQNMLHIGFHEKRSSCKSQEYLGTQS